MQVMNSNFLQVPLCDLTDYDGGGTPCRIGGELLFVYHRNS